jgi:hypothetical protein
MAMVGAEHPPYRLSAVGGVKRVGEGAHHGGGV